MVAPVAPVAPVARAIVVPVAANLLQIAIGTILVPKAVRVVPAVEAATAAPAAVAAMVPQACPTRWPWSPAAACKAAKPPVTAPSLPT